MVALGTVWNVDREFRIDRDWPGDDLCYRVTYCISTEGRLMTKVLVTGGGGYIGTTLVSLLLKKGYRVRVLDNLSHGGDQLIPFFREPNFEFQLGDVRNWRDVAQAVSRQDAIVHLAAIVGYPACKKNPDAAKTTNIGGTIVLNQLRSKNQLILFGSTSSVYGHTEEPVDEACYVSPISLYAETKFRAENELIQKDSAIIYRLAGGFGVSPRMRLDLLLNDWVYQAVTKGKLTIYEPRFVRTFLHVHDIARVFLFGIDNASKMTGQIFNVGSDKMNLTKQELSRKIQRRTACHLIFTTDKSDADKRSYTVIYKKIAALGFHARVTLEQGIDEIIKAVPAISKERNYTNQ